jgi:hypothetical protein
LLVSLQHGYLQLIEPQHIAASVRMIWFNGAEIAIIGVGEFALVVFGQERALYILPSGILLVFVAVGINVWVLLIEINR